MAGGILDMEAVHRRFANRKAKIGQFIWFSMLVSGFLAVSVVGTVIVLSILERPVPDTLQNWGGIIIGFYFGTFISLLKDYVTEDDQGTEG